MKTKTQATLTAFLLSRAILTYNIPASHDSEHWQRKVVATHDARFVARLKAEYDKGLGVLLPIKAQLARTDALMDQVVYRLYGLSEEEIAVVARKR